MPGFSRGERSVHASVKEDKMDFGREEARHSSSDLLPLSRRRKTSEDVLSQTNRGQGRAPPERGGGGESSVG